MAFSNEYLTEEEKELIKETELDSLLYIKRSQNKIIEVICQVDWCTTDREKKIWLINCLKRADFEPKLKEESFVIFWGAIHKDNLIELRLKKLGNEKDPLVKKQHDVEMIKYWALKEIKISPQLEIDRKTIWNMLEAIMTAYAISGDPKEKGPEYESKFKAFIKEYKEG